MLVTVLGILGILPSCSLKPVVCVFDREDAFYRANIALLLSYVSSHFCHTSALRMLTLDIHSAAI
jgi:hypothetical protein